MKIKILSWNVRGANDRDKRKIIKLVIKSQSVDVVYLQETKIKEMTTRLVRILGVQLEVFWCFGITQWWSWLIWKKGNSQFRAGSKIVWTDWCGCSLVCMGRYAAGIERISGRSLGQ